MFQETEDRQQKPKNTEGIWSYPNNLEKDHTFARMLNKFEDI